MAVEITVPVLGEGVESGDVLEIFVQEGDVISPDDGLIELETDKATVTVPATSGGKVVKVHVSEGQTVKVGDPIVSVEPSGAAAQPAAPTDAPAAQAPAEPEKTPEPESSEPETPEPPVAEPTATAPNPAPKPAAEPTATPSSPVTTPTPAEAPVASAVQESATTAPSSNGGVIAAGPAIRRLAREVGIDLATIKGTGPGGRITREDVMQAVRGCAQRQASGASAAPAGETDGHGPVRIEKMPRIRQTIARKMHESWTTVPRVTNFDDADVTALEEIRQNSKKDYAARNIKLTSMPFIIKAVAMALKSHPVVNASVDLEAGQIIYKEYVNIGIAVDTDRGLVVPSLRNADKLPIPEIARQLSEIAQKARDNTFSVEDLRGSTFSISNLGAIGGTYSTPIINTPETAILLIGRSRKLPVVMEDDSIRVRLMMPLSLSYDHRLIDGGAAARFLNEVIGYLEAPSRLLLAP